MLVAFFGFTLFAAVLGDVSKDDLNGRYVLLSVETVKLPFCTDVMQVDGRNGVVRASEISFDGEQACDGGALKFEFASNTGMLTNDTGALGNVLVSMEKNVLKCGDDRVGAMALRPEKTTKVLDFVFPGKRRYFVFFEREGEWGKCYYAESQSEKLQPAASRPTAKVKAQPKLKPAKPIKVESKSGAHSKWRWLGPLIAGLILVPLVVCFVLLWRKRRRDAIVKPLSTIPSPPTPRRVAPASPPRRIRAPPRVRYTPGSPPILRITAATHTSPVSPEMDTRYMGDNCSV